MNINKIITTLSLVLLSFNCLAFSERVIDDPNVVGTLYYTDGELDQPVIVLLGGSEGGNFVGNNALLMLSVKDLVKNGYAVISLAYFDYNSSSNIIPNALKRVPLEYFGQVLSWVKVQSDLKSDSVGIYGISRGGELALLLASKFKVIDLVIAGVPSSYVWGSYDKNITEEEWYHMAENDPCQPAWTWKGQDVASVCNKDMMNYDPWYKIIDNTEFVKDYLIPVENSTAAIFLTSATHDQVWPSTKMSEQIISKLEEKKYPYPFKHIAYRSNHDVYSKSWKDVLSFIKLHYPAI